jgi:phenylalanyl-tRNA synthetase beta chain
MKITLNWLKDYVHFDMTASQIGHLLTMSGLEVEGIESAGSSLEDVLVARLIDFRAHPKADRLSICEVDDGARKRQIVCGAPNLKKNMLVAFAPPGVKLPNDTVIKETEIRGEISAGVLLAEDEMGLTDDHSGIMVLPPRKVPGTPISSALPLMDWVLDVSITPNRPDCASVIGIAREIAALTGSKHRLPPFKFRPGGPPVTDLTNVAIEDPIGCPRYAAGLICGVKQSASPFWMRYRLHLCGIRSINNIVDVTNYVMLELGQPLHAFDYHRLNENRIVVKRAQNGQVFTTLDGISHTMSDEHLMICDGQRAVALAGIMGGLNSEIFAGTEDVLIESAYFDPVTIRRGSKKLSISTEASYRFERGIDLEGTVTALRRALYLTKRLAGGSIAHGIIDNYPTKYRPHSIDLRVDKTNSLLGTQIPSKDMARYLKSLGMKVKKASQNVLRVMPPSFRVDVTREVDLAEEVARLNGYDQIPVTPPTIRPSDEQETPEHVLRHQTGMIMLGLGFSEIITYSFTSPDHAQILGFREESTLKHHVKILNPLTKEHSVMRTSLIPGLLMSIKYNIQHGEKALRLFEWGKVFIKEGDDQLPLEKTFLAAIITGPFAEKTWYTQERMADFYDIKGCVQAVLEGLKVEGVAFEKNDVFAGYHPDSFTGIYCAGSLIGRLGQVAPAVLAGYEIGAQGALMFELDIEALLTNAIGPLSFRPFARFPAVIRDISIILDRVVESARVNEIIEREGHGLVESVCVFDLYDGKKMASGDKAISFRITYRSKERTLDGSQVNAVHDHIIDTIRKETGGRLREG